MLQKIAIQNYAIIEELMIDLSGKLNVITGETGAGKSIIAGALGLLMGDRADSGILLNKEKKCVVEGTFDPQNIVAITEFLSDNELDHAEELVIRREIGSNGKSRAFINDTPVNLSQLHALSALLVDLHQQFDTLDLGESNFQRDILDALASHQSGLREYSETFRKWQLLKKETDELIARQLQFEKETDFNRFQFTELEEAGFRENELEDIDAELKVLNNAGEIKSVLSRVYFELDESETPIVHLIKSLTQQLANIQNYHPGILAIVERLHSMQVELQDVAGDLDRLNSRISFDPQRMNELNERLSLGYRLQKKHGVQTTNELLEVQRELEQKLTASLEIGSLILDKERQAESLIIDITQKAQQISIARKRQVKPFEEAVNKLLVQVGMPNARLKVEIKQAEPSLYGIDIIEFLFNANVGNATKTTVDNFYPIRKVASGGELSRLMLCIKSLVAESLDLPTLIFDEIDSGISGEAARQVGIIMKKLASKRQVICITHQPQIAGKADAHFFVFKEIVKDKVRTSIKQLTVDERITAIAKMLSGEKPTAAAMENAREMIMN